VGLTPGLNRSMILYTPIVDPYATKLTNLWYSWASYYQNLPQFTQFNPQELTATVTADSDNAIDTRILTFTSPQPQLAVGMNVTEAGITNLTTILKISADMKTFYLSTPVPVDSGKSATFKFSKPAPIAFADETTNIPISFALATPAEQQTAAAFAGVVYELLSVYSTINPRKVPQLLGSMETVGNAMGGNVGFLPTANIGTPPDVINLKNISADVRDLGKSALRGVPDFADIVKYPPATAWYPDPAKRTGDQTYNVYNLDPYVWFVHQQAHLSGYGFSFDDDTADVGANGAKSLAITVGGLKGLINDSEWFPSTPWGEITAHATISTPTSGGYAGKTLITIDGPDAVKIFNQLFADDPANSLVGAYVSGPGIPTGADSPTNLLATADIGQNQFILSQSIKGLFSGTYTFSGKPRKPVRHPAPPPPVSMGLFF